MTPPHEPDPLAAATAQLREQPVHRAVEIADAVLRRSLAAPRPAVLVRCAEPYAWVRVSSTVLVELLRASLDGALVGAAVSRVVLDVDRREHLEGLTIELLVEFGHDILRIGDQARALADATLRAVVGRDSAGDDDGHDDGHDGGGDGLVVRLAHVHVADVTRGDPHVVDVDE